MRRWGCGFIPTLMVVSIALVSCGRMVAKPAGVAEATLALRVEAGSPDTYVDKAGHTWQGEKEYAAGGGFGFVGGQIVDRGTERKIEGTNDPRIYRTERYAMTAFKAEVPNGKYTVRLHFAETSPGVMKGPGLRIFDVKIQGNTVLSDFDVMKEAGGADKALMKEFKGIAVSDGILDIAFVAKKQNPEINGIEILGE